MFSLFHPQPVALVAEKGEHAHAAARAVGRRRRRGGNQRRPSAVQLERQHWLVFGNNNHPVHGDAHCVVMRCADFAKVRVADESRLEMAISTASGEGGMRLRARTHAEFNQWTLTLALALALTLTPTLTLTLTLSLTLTLTRRRVVCGRR